MTRTFVTSSLPRAPPPSPLQVFPLLQRHSANFSRDIVVYNFG